MPARLRRLSWLLAALVELAGCRAPLAAESLSREAAWLQRYLRFDTSQPAGTERPAIEFLAERLREAGASTEILVSPRGRANLVARLPASTPGSAVLVLLHHVDVVPAEGAWKLPPFAGEEEGSALHGRGAIDAKSYGIAHLAALAAAAKLPLRTREIVYLAVADEEAGGAEGAGWLLESHPELLQRVEAVLNEGGANKSVGERLLYWGIEIEQKRPLWLEVRAAGRGGHASNADRGSAVHRLIAGLARLVADPAPLRGSRAGLEFLTRLGKLDPRAARAAAAARKLVTEDPLTAPDRQALVGYEALFSDTLQVTTLSGSRQTNVVASAASARLDIRLLPETDATAYLAALREQLGPELEVEVLHATPAAAASPTEGSQGTVWRRLGAELERLAPRVPIVPLLIPATTDSRYFRARGIPAYGFSPFVLDARELLTVHAVDERISIASFDRGVATMTAVVRALVTAPVSQPAQP